MCKTACSHAPRAWLFTCGSKLWAYSLRSTPVATLAARPYSTPNKSFLKEDIPMANLVFLLLSIIMATANPAQADDLFTEPCIQAGIPKDLVLAIAKQESSLHPWALNIRGIDYMPETYKDAVHLVRRAEGAGVSYDVGIMQINNYWIKKWGIDPIDLLAPETNIRRGISILAAEIERHGFTWKAVGRYHSPTEWRSQDYAWRVFKRMGGKSHGSSSIIHREKRTSGDSVLEFRGIWRGKGVQRPGRIISFSVHEAGQPRGKDTKQRRSPGQTADDAGNS